MQQGSLTLSQFIEYNQVNEEYYGYYILEGGLSMGQKITEDMTIAQVLRLKPNSVKVFMEVGMHCFGCGAATGESVAQAAMVHGVDLNKLLADLNNVH